MKVEFLGFGKFGRKVDGCKISLDFRKSQDSLGNKIFLKGMLEAIGFWWQLFVPIEKGMFLG